MACDVMAFNAAQPEYPEEGTRARPCGVATIRITWPSTRRYALSGHIGSGVTKTKKEVPTTKAATSNTVMPRT